MAALGRTYIQIQRLNYNYSIHMVIRTFQTGFPSPLFLRNTSIRSVILHWSRNRGISLCSRGD